MFSNKIFATILLAVVMVSNTSAFALVPSRNTSGKSLPSKSFRRHGGMSSSSSQLSMALESQPPAFRKNVMAAAVSAAAMPALVGATSAAVGSGLVATAVTGTVAFFGGSVPSFMGNFDVHDPRVLAALFVSHWIVTNYFLQKFPDRDEIQAMKNGQE